MTASPDSPAPARKALKAHHVMLPVAALYGAAIVPLWLLLMTGAVPGADRLPPSWHGHEMIFGFALAVVGGYLMTRASGWLVWLALATWLLGRLPFWGLPLPQPLPAVVALLFPAMVFWQAGVPFLKAVKRKRNIVFAPILGAFSVAEILYQLGAADVWAPGLERGLLLAIDLITVLMFVMGGRVIAAATSGAIQRRGGYVKGMAQIKVEGVTAVVLGLVLVFDVSGVEGHIPAALRAAAAGLILYRMARWRVWRVVPDIEVSSLHLGYLWIAAGLLLSAALPILLDITVLSALHGITVGALGTLAFSMIVRTTLQKARRPVVFAPSMTMCTLALSFSALFRLAYEGSGAQWQLTASAVIWSACFLVLGVFALREGRR